MLVSRHFARRDVTVVKAYGGEPGECQVEEFPRTVDIVVTSVGGEHLPPQTPFTPSFGYTALLLGLLVEDGLGQGEPLGLVGLGIDKSGFGSQHGRETPEGLIIVTHRSRPVSRHVVTIRTGLMDHGGQHHVVVRLVLRPGAVIEQSPPHGAALPPVVITIGGRTGKDTGYPAGPVDGVE